MGAGKSTIGRQLSSKLSFEFLDTDHIIENRSGADIPWIFDVEGEEGFRDRETAVLKDLVGVSSAVIATGGGLVLREENRELLRQLGKVYYLRANVDQLVRRTQKDKKRPLLQVADPRKKIEEIFEHRDPIYRDVADKVIVTDGSSAKNVVQQIIEDFSAA